MISVANPIWSWHRLATFRRKKRWPRSRYSAPTFPISRSLHQRRRPVQVAAHNRTSSRIGRPRFDSLLTADKPIIFNLWLINRLAYGRANHGNMHVRGYKERGSITAPMELAISNEIDRFTLAIEAVNRSETPEDRGARQGKISRSSDRLPELLLRARHRQAGDRRLALAVLAQRPITSNMWIIQAASA
jgi:hypothetical protein